MAPSRLLSLQLLALLFKPVKAVILLPPSVFTLLWTGWQSIVRYNAVNL